MVPSKLRFQPAPSTSWADPSRSGGGQGAGHIDLEVLAAVEAERDPVGRARGVVGFGLAERQEARERGGAEGGGFADAREVGVGRLEVLQRAVHRGETDRLQEEVRGGQALTEEGPIFEEFPGRDGWARGDDAAGS
jgi:hypothetical protein